MRGFSSRGAGVAAAATFGAMAIMEAVDWAKRPVTGDRVEDAHTGDLVGAAIATAVAVSGVSVFRPSARPLPRSRVFAAGIALIWSGIGLNRWARATLGRHYRPVVTVVQDHDIVTRGPYGFIRHPMYLGGMTICAGSAVAVWSPMASIAWCLPPLAIVRRIVVEERVLADALGDTYAQFAAGRQRLIPGVW